MAMARWRPFLIVLQASAALSASAQPEGELQKVLDAVDAAVRSAGGWREGKGAPALISPDSPLCDRKPIDGAEKVLRDYLCESSTLVGRWGLWSRVGTGLDWAMMEVRRFNSPEEAWTTKATGVERYGGAEPLDIAKDTVTNGHLQVYWVGDLLFAVQYAYSNTPSQTKPIGAALDALRKLATPFEDTGVVGVDNWGVLFAGESEKRVGVPDRARFRHFFKIADTEANRMLWLRAKPSVGGPGEKLGKISTDATCLPRVLDPPLDTHAVYFRDIQGWVEVKFEGKEVWIKRDFIEKQPMEQCR